MAIRLTDLTVASCRADAGKRQEIADALVPGLFLVVQATGAKSWAIRYRAAGKPVKHTLGPYPRLSLKSARDLARDALSSVAEGNDPAAERRKVKRLEPAHISRPASLGPDASWWSVVQAFEARELATKRSGPQVMVALRRETEARWQDRSIGDLTRADVAELVDEIKSGAGRRRGPAPVQAARVLAYVSWVFSWALKRDMVTVNPCTKVDKPINEYERRRTRVLDDEELTLVWNAATDQGYPFGAIVQMLILTGARLREVAHAEWSEIDLRRGVWTIPAERAKNGDARVIALTQPMIDLLASLSRVGINTRHVFTTNGETPVSGFSRAKKRLEATLTTLDASRASPAAPPVLRGPFVLHDLRRSVASGLARLKVPFEVIERVLGHRGESASGLRAVYNRHSYETEMREALVRWNTHVTSLALPTGNNVVVLGRRA